MTTRCLPFLPRCLHRSIAAAVFCFTTPFVGAQTAPTTKTTAVSAASDKSDETILLSPFTVVEDDKGYQAFNTAAGTRLNSKLEDLGSSITVVTKQQMQDTAVLDINDLFRYEASTEGTDDFTQFTPNRTGGVGDNIQGDPSRANRIRGVGSAGTSGSGVNNAWGNFSSNSKIPFDLYNVGAIEISRGPNSNLFGLGASAGTVNLVPDEASTAKPTANATFRADSFGGHRSSLSLNRPLIAGKLAMKVAAVEESKGFVRQPSAERIHREYVSLFARPFKNTSIRASAERYNNSYRRPNSITPRDTSDEWKAGGSPTWDPTTQIVTLSNGTKSGPFAANATDLHHELAVLIELHNARILISNGNKEIAVGEKCHSCRFVESVLGRIRSRRATRVSDLHQKLARVRKLLHGMPNDVHGPDVALRVNLDAVRRLDGRVRPGRE